MNNCNDELLEAIDQRSLALAYSKSSVDIGWLEAIFWKESKKTAMEQPEALEYMMSKSAIKALALATDSDLLRLQSKSITSFSYCSDSLNLLLKNGHSGAGISSDSKQALIAREFISLIKQESIERGIAVATQMFSMKAVTVKQVQNSQRSKLYEAPRFMGKPFLRFQDSLLIQILKASPDDLPALQLKKIQQCLCSGASASADMHEIKTETLSCYDENISEGRANIALNRELYARSLLITGHLIKTVGIETGLTLRQVRRINDNVKAAKYESETSDKIRTPRSSNIFIQSSADILQASLAMALYLNIGGHDIYKTTNMDALNTAFSLYCTIRHDVFGVKERLDRTFFLPDMWVLAIEIRSNHASYLFCESCKTLNFISINQRTVSSDCSFEKPTVARRALESFDK